MKNRHSFLSLIFFLLGGLCQAQPATEVYLFDLSYQKGHYSLTNPINISQNEGYDNQPAFLADGSGILFVQNHDGQTEVMHYVIATGKKKRLTHSAAGEYSPTPMPGNTRFSTIVLEPDGTQLLWSFTMKGEDAQVVRPDLKIGYHAWIDANMLFSFVLGDPVTLQQSLLLEDKDVVITENIGRSLHKIPGKKLLSFVDKQSEDQWVIKSVNPKNATTKFLSPTVKGSEDLAWTPQRRIIMGQGSKLFVCKPRKNAIWKEVIDLSPFGMKGITRLAISPKGEKIAIVVEEGE